jgi:signal transduction histidine kinase
MLTLARLEEAPVEKTESCNLQSVMRLVMDRLQPLAELKQVALEVSAAETHAVAMPASDAELLCSNLIVNALQHSAPNGRVSVLVQERGGIESVVELRVTDQGEGIPEEALPHIFERFFRVDRSRSRSSGGAGLGLSICKAIVERLEGTIHIQSAMGRGTEVTVTLPARLSPS